MNKFYMKKVLASFKWLILSMLLSSCVESLDFDQVDNLELTPVMKSTLIYFTVDQTDK